ncbi:hypothetical protein DITRI_Ditri03aG0180600 [Diplodiscus trichospermus]
MNQSRVHSQGNVPFSWENRPGVCKETATQEGSNYFVQKQLEPFPCPPESAIISIDDIKIPPPPHCAFHPPSRTSSGRGLKKSDDPFLAAYKECTKSSNKKDGGSGSMKGLFNFSCKAFCSVRNDNLVRISQLPIERGRSGKEM